MKSRNMHYYYNVEYFYDAMVKPGNYLEYDYSGNNEEVCDFRFKDDSYRKTILNEEILKENRKDFTLKTVYPGLLSGSGYMHDMKGDKTIIGGFFFDYVTGIPMIPGSTLKGVLRSYFQESKWETVRELAAGIGADLSEAGLEEVCENLFEQKDVYIGGFPVVEKPKRLLDSEYITPHKGEFKNPIPLRFVKVRPGVEFQFIFLLHDFKNEKTILTAEQKAALYKELLKLGGIGAKTNVGFGQFTES